MTEKTMPPLPSGSVDLDALHRADAKGADLAKAVEAATTRKAPPPSDEADEPEFDVPFGYTVSAKRGGWFEIAGPEGFEPVNAHGADEVRARLAEISAAGTSAGATE